jgi:predicted metal-binding transcription factor (methanogenesis marker protein 9)
MSGRVKTRGKVLEATRFKAVSSSATTFAAIVDCCRPTLRCLSATSSNGVSPKTLMMIDENLARLLAHRAPDAETKNQKINGPH